MVTALRRSLIEPVDELLSLRAGGPLDVNELDFVVDSSWYRNPTGGPAGFYGYRGFSSSPPAFAAMPSLLGPWRVLVAGRYRGRLWLVVRDGRHRVFLLRFDAPGHDGLATASELVVTRILAGLGYFVPVRSMVLFRTGRLSWSEALPWCPGRRGPTTSSSLATLTLGTGRCTFRGSTDVRRALARVPMSVGGTTRALSTRLATGRDLGPFPLSGTRTDDPNDRFAHDRRRSLRALRLIGSWLDLRSLGEGTGRDLYQGGRVYHFLWFLEGGLGVSPSGVPRPGSGGEYSRAGTWPAWASPSLSWRPLLRHPGLAAAAGPDLFWAARILSVWSAARIRALVDEAYLPDELARSLLSRLIATKNRAVKLGLSSACAAGDFHVEKDGLGRGRFCFKDLSMDNGSQGPFVVRWAGRRKRFNRSLHEFCVTLPRGGGRLVVVHLVDGRHRRGDVWLRRGPSSTWKVLSVRRF